MCGGGKGCLPCPLGGWIFQAGKKWKSVGEEGKRHPFAREMFWRFVKGGRRGKPSSTTQEKGSATFVTCERGKGSSIPAEKKKKSVVRKKKRCAFWGALNATQRGERQGEAFSRRRKEKDGNIILLEREGDLNKIKQKGANRLVDGVGGEKEKGGGLRKKVDVTTFPSDTRGMY